jgi:hypothetical protein
VSETLLLLELPVLLGVVALGGAGVGVTGVGGLAGVGVITGAVGWQLEQPEPHELYPHEPQ